MSSFITDFDGTLTEHDFFELVRRRWPAEPGADPWEQYRAGQLTHFEALARIFASIRTSEAELLALVDSMEIAPGLAESVSALQAAGWEVVIASAGCDWYIRHLLASAGVTVRLYANPGTFHPDRGLEMRLPPPSPFFSPATGVDKAKIVEDALRQDKRVAYAGDGPPDLEPALLVAPARRFARRWLAEELERKAEPFSTFANWREVADTLLGQKC